jgi:hypothetical protein
VSTVPNAISDAAIWPGVPLQLGSSPPSALDNVNPTAGNLSPIDPQPADASFALPGTYDPVAAVLALERALAALMAQTQQATQVDTGELGPKAGGPTRVNGAQGNLVAEISTPAGASTDANVRVISSSNANKSTGTTWGFPIVRTLQLTMSGLNMTYDSGDQFSYSNPGAGGYCTLAGPGTPRTRPSTVAVNMIRANIVALLGCAAPVRQGRCARSGEPQIWTPQRHATFGCEMRTKFSKWEINTGHEGQPFANRWP